MENNVKQTDIYYDNKQKRFQVLRKTWIIFFFGFLVEFFAFNRPVFIANRNYIDSGIFLIKFYFLSLLFLIFYALCVYFFISCKDKWCRFLILLISMSRVPLFFQIYASIDNDWGFSLLFIVSIIPSIVWNIIIFLIPYHLLNKIDSAKLQQ